MLNGLLPGYIYFLLGILGAALQAAVIRVLLRKHHRAFPILLIYLVLVFLATLAGLTFYLENVPWRIWSLEFAWVTNVVLHLALFAVVISLAGTVSQRANPGEGRSRQLRLWLLVAGVVVVSLAFSSGPTLSRYMNTVSRNLSFATLILNSLLWTSLLRWRHPDRRVFSVCSGLGINMAGDAIGQSLRDLWRTAVAAGDLIMVITHLAFLGVLWHTFRAAPPEEHGLPPVPKQHRV